MRFLILALFSFLMSSLWSQLRPDVDTLYYTDRTGGKLDSAHISRIPYASTVDGGRFHLSPQVLNGGGIFYNHFRPFRILIEPASHVRFSALPRIGFHYSFGAQGTQFFHFNYTHSYNKHLTLNLDYDRYSTNNYLRNSAFENHRLDLKLVGTWKRYGFELNAGYGLHKINFSGGLVSDSLLETFGLAFMPVNKSDARSRQEEARVNLRQYLDFGDSLDHFGVFVENKMDIVNRKFWENDTLYGLYDSYIDSFQTYDQYNLPLFSNSGGLYFSRSQFYVDISADLAYWEYQNTGLYNDTTEWDLSSRISFRGKRFKLWNQFNFNVSGNFGEWSEHLNLSHELNEKNKIVATLFIGELTPSIHQRFYRSNIFNYNLSEISKSTEIRGELLWRSSSDSSAFQWQAGVLMNQFINPFTWSDSMWSNANSIDLSVVSAKLGINWNWKKLYLNNEFQYNLNEENKIPQFTYFGRFYLKSAVFEAKKMILIAGVEPRFTSSFAQQAFLPVMDVYYWLDDAALLPAMFNLNAFAGFEIDEFRFYLRMEELGWLWNDKRRQDIQDYSLPGMRLRVGVIWDFFN